MKYRSLEPWMVRGAKVKTSTYRGTIQVVITTLTGKGPDVMHFYVQPEGVIHAWPLNPWEVEPIHQNIVPVTSNTEQMRQFML